MCQQLVPLSASEAAEAVALDTDSGSHIWHRCVLSTTAPDSERRRLGAFGWLLACRQGYLEGVDVLYMTNTFSIQSDKVLDALFRPPGDEETPGYTQTYHIAFPDRFALITSLEVGWHSLKVLQRHIGSLPGPFQNLHRLVLCLTEVYLPSSVADIDSGVLGPIAEAVSRLPLRAQKRNVIVEVSAQSLAKIRSRTRLAQELKLRGKGGSGDNDITWLRYPVPARDTEQEGGDGDDSEVFYYIKGKSAANRIYYSHHRDIYDEATRRITLLPFICGATT